MKSARDLEQFIHIHAHYVVTIHERCLLHKKLTFLKDAVTKVLNLILIFSARWDQGIAEIRCCIFEMSLECVKKKKKNKDSNMTLYMVLGSEGLEPLLILGSAFVRVVHISSLSSSPSLWVRSPFHSWVSWGKYTVMCLEVWMSLL